MRWFGRSLLAAIPVALGVMVCVFLLLRIVPGDPARMILGEQATTDSINALRDQLGLNLPVGQQLWTYLLGVFTRADIGTSLTAFSKGFSLISPICSIVLKIQAISVQSGIISHEPCLPSFDISPIRPKGSINVKTLTTRSLNSA